MATKVEIAEELEILTGSEIDPEKYTHAVLTEMLRGAEDAAEAQEVPEVLPDVDTTKIKQSAEVPEVLPDVDTTKIKQSAEGTEVPTVGYLVAKGVCIIAKGRHYNGDKGDIIPAVYLSDPEKFKEQGKIK